MLSSIQDRFVSLGQEDREYVEKKVDDQVDMTDSEPEDEIRQEMRRLSETSESRRLQVFQANKQLKKAQETLNELRKAIKLKVIAVSF